MNHLILPPPPALAPYVKYFWALVAEEDVSNTIQISTLVNDASGIAVQHHNGRSALVESGSFLLEAMVYGITTKPKVNYPVSGFTAVGVIFYPHTLHELFGMEAGQLTDREVHLNEFAGWNITDAILNTADINKQIEILTDFLVELLLKKTQQDDALVKDAVSRIQATQGLFTVHELAGRYNISERQLERRFNDTVGVPPRHYLKVTRFQEAIHLLKNIGDGKLSDIAYSLDYADQAHFIRHVKQLSGLTPKELAKKLVEVPMNQTDHIPYLIGARPSGC